MILRVIIAMLAVVFAFLLIPPFLRILELSVSGDVMLVLKLCIAALAIFYVLRGRWPA